METKYLQQRITFGIFGSCIGGETDTPRACEASEVLVLVGWYRVASSTALRRWPRIRLSTPDRGVYMDIYWR